MDLEDDEDDEEDLWWEEERERSFSFESLLDFLADGSSSEEKTLPLFLSFLRELDRDEDVFESLDDDFRPDCEELFFLSLSRSLSLWWLLLLLLWCELWWCLSLDFDSSLR